MTLHELKSATIQELNIIIENCNFVLNAPMTYPKFDVLDFHTGELNDRTSWSRRKTEAENEIKDRNCK